MSNRYNISTFTPKTTSFKYIYFCDCRLVNFIFFNPISLNSYFVVSLIYSFFQLTNWPLCIHLKKVTDKWNKHLKSRSQNIRIRERNREREIRTLGFLYTVFYYICPNYKYLLNIFVLSYPEIWKLTPPLITQPWLLLTSNVLFKSHCFRLDF